MSLLLLHPKAEGGSAPPGLPTLQRPIPHVRVAWRPEQFGRVTNPGFETTTSGWSVSAGINGTATSITRVTTDPKVGTGYGQLITTATTDSGVNFDFGAQRFVRMVETATLWLRRVSGGRRVKVVLGSEGTDRTTLVIDELPEQWTRYTLRWLPTAERTDVQLAIMTNDAQVATIDIDDVTVWTDALTQLEWDEDATSEWTIDGSGDSAAATSLTTVQSAMTLVTSASDESGMDHDLGTRLFTSGRTYRLLAFLRNISGSTSTRLRIGSPTALFQGDVFQNDVFQTLVTQDETDTDVTTTSTGAWYSIDWTPSADRSAVQVSIGNGAAATQTLSVSHVEVYEALDEVGVSEIRTSHGANFDGSRERPGTVRVVVLDPDETYSPRNASSALFPDVRPGRRIQVRAVYQGVVHGLGYGVVRTVTPDPFALTVTLDADDGLFELDNEVTSRPFTDANSYRAARLDALSILPTKQLDLSNRSTESNHFHDGTDDEESVLDFLEDLNQATGTVHRCQPLPSAAHPWAYVTVERARQTRDLPSLGFIVDEDFQRLRVSATDEAFITRQRVTWQGYEAGLGRESDGSVVNATASLPYLIFVDEEFGSSDRPQPEGIFKLKRQTRRKVIHRRGRRIVKRRRFRKLKRVGTKFVDAVVPVTVPAGERSTIVVDFLIPMRDISITATGSSATTEVVEPSRAIVHIDAGASSETVTALSITATPFRPLDEQTETRTTWEAGVQAEGRDIDNEYVPSAGAAEGLADYLTWRYGAPRMRPTLILRHRHPTQLTAKVADPVQLSADRWHIDDARYIVRSVSHSVSRGGFEWDTELGLEELPPDSEGKWVVLNGPANSGLDSSFAVLAH